jgi:protein DEK
VSSLKKNVGQCSGFPFEKGSIQYKKKEEMLKKLRNAMLKSICEVLDLERTGEKDLEFLNASKAFWQTIAKNLKKILAKGIKRNGTVLEW